MLHLLGETASTYQLTESTIRPYSASPFSSRGGSRPVRPAASRMKKRLSAGHPVDEAEAEVADQADGQQVVGEQAVEAVGDRFPWR